MAEELPKPWNDEFERAVLGSFFIDPKIYLDVLETGLTAGDFHLPCNQIIFDEAIASIRETGFVELLMFVERLKVAGKLEMAGGWTHLASLQSFVLFTGAAPEIAERLVQMSTSRKMMLAADRIKRASSDQEYVGDELLDWAKGELSVAGGTVRRLEEDDHAAAVKAIVDELRSPKELSPTLQTKLPDIDRVLSLRRGQNLVIGARPSVGKSALAGNIVLNHVERTGDMALILSYEMTQEDWRVRWLSMLSGVDIQKYRRINKPPTPAEQRLVDEAAARLSPLPIRVVEMSGKPIHVAEAAVARYKDRNPSLSLIVLDHLALVPPRKGQEMRHAVEESSRTMKSMALKHKLYAVTLSQLNRESDKGRREPEMHDLRETGGIEQDADAILMLHRDPNIKLDATTMDYPVLAKIVKNRGGALGRATLNYRPMQTHFVCMVKEEGNHEPY